MYFMGIDVGSLSCDAVIIDEEGGMMAFTVIPTGARNIESIESARRTAIDSAGVSEDDIAATIATGYGRDRV